MKKFKLKVIATYQMEVQANTLEEAKTIAEENLGEDILENWGDIDWGSFAEAVDYTEYDKYVENNKGFEDTIMGYDDWIDAGSPEVEEKN